MSETNWPVDVTLSSLSFRYLSKTNMGGFQEKADLFLKGSDFGSSRTRRTFYFLPKRVERPLMVPNGRHSTYPCLDWSGHGLTRGIERNLVNDAQVKSHEKFSNLAKEFGVVLQLTATISSRELLIFWWESYLLFCRDPHTPQLKSTLK